MGAPQNGDFEDAVAPGSPLPANWTQQVTSTAVEIADFGDGSGAELFETGWFLGTFIAEFGLSDIGAAVFDTATGPKDFEPFDSWQDVDGFFFVLPSTEAAIFGVDAFEDFETWATLIPSFGFGTITAAQFDDGLGGTPNEETFEGGWRGNENFAASMPASVAATFGPSAAAFEDFESSRPPNPFTVNVATNTIVTQNPHLLSNGDKFTLEIEVTDDLAGQLPDGLQPNKNYLAVVTGANTVQATLDGSTVIDIQDQGAGNFVLVHDKTKFWTTFMEL